MKARRRSFVGSLIALSALAGGGAAAEPLEAVNDGLPDGSL